MSNGRLAGVTITLSYMQSLGGGLETTVSISLLQLHREMFSDFGACSWFRREYCITIDFLKYTLLLIDWQTHSCQNRLCETSSPNVSPLNTCPPKHLPTKISTHWDTHPYKSLPTKTPAVQKNPPTVTDMMRTRALIWLGLVRPCCSECHGMEFWTLFRMS